MCVNDPTDPYTDHASKCWPLEEHHYAEVFAVLLLVQDRRPSSLERPALAHCPRRCPPQKQGALPKIATKTRTLCETADTPLLTRVAV